MAELIKGVNDLQTKYPEIAAEWHFTKNEDLTPSDVTCGSRKKVWWKCKKGHEWLMRIEHRTMRNCKCPYCSNRRILVGYNDLATINPELADEWNYEKNGDLKPTDVALNCNKQVWWKCRHCGYEWKVSPNNRYSNKTGCSKCGKQKAVNHWLSRIKCEKGSLLDNYPELVVEWHPTKNGDLTPSDVTCGSRKKVWWKCKKGHEWQATVNSRVRGNGCFMCSNAGTSLPEQGVAFYLEQVCEIKQRYKIAKQEIDVFLPGYKIGIEYDGRFFHTNSNHSKELYKENELLKQGILLIRIKEANVNKIDSHIIYYKTDNMGKNYEDAIVNLCVMLNELTGNNRFNDIKINVQNDIIAIRNRVDLYMKQNSLAVNCPDLVNEWNYEKNISLTPDMFAVTSNIKVWWKCKKGHEWKASISHRFNGTGCPYCSGRNVIMGKNDLATLYPELTKEWNYEKNNNLRDKYGNDISIPNKIKPHSSQKVWWKCKKGHEWETSVSQRTMKHTGCPYCFGRNHKSIVCIETNKIYKSFVDASVDVFGDKSKSGAISNVCKHKPHCKSVGGYHWKYVDEEGV